MTAPLSLSASTPRLCITCNRPVAGPFDSHCGKCEERMSEHRAELAEQEINAREYRWENGG